MGIQSLNERQMRAQLRAIDDDLANAKANEEMAEQAYRHARQATYKIVSKQTDKKIELVGLMDAMQNEDAAMIIENGIDIGVIKTTYVGKVGCMCGCGGSYVNTEKGAKDSYHDDDDFNMSTVKRRIALFIKRVRANEFDELEIAESYIYLQRGERCMCLYTLEDYSNADVVTPCENNQGDEA